MATPDTITPDSAGPNVAPSAPEIPETITLPGEGQSVQTQLGPRYRVIIHNDDVTTFEYVQFILGAIFLLSEELAEHIAMTAHTHGSAVVVVRPRREAETLAKAASSRARLDGFPLTFSVEEQE